MIKTVSDLDCKKFWFAAKEIVDAAGNYAGKVKLRANVLDESTRHVVNDVFEKYHGGDMANLEASIDYYNQCFIGKVEKFNLLCQYNGVPGVMRPKELRNLLLSEKKRSSFKGRIKTCLKNSEICPLQDFVKKSSK